jgi:hypothetical protein
MRVRALGDEYDALRRACAGITNAHQVARARRWLEVQHAAALHQKALIEDALEQFVSVELLLVTSPPLRRELRAIARAAQADGDAQLEPQRVNHEIARCTWLTLSDLDPAPRYLGRGLPSAREYLIHTAMAAECQILITEDDDLALPGNASHRDPKTRRSARPYTIEEFLQDELPFQLEFDAIDAAAIFRATRCRGS